MLQIYDSLTKSKQVFKPVHPGKVNMYVCGNTVYDYCHIGHARSMIIFDMIVRYLRYRGYEVTYVRNITDIEDKIINRANENQESCDALTERFIDAQHEDEVALNLLPVDHEPRATEYVQPIIELIQRIIANGYAYAVNNGDVYFDVNKFTSYGKLSHRDIESLKVGVRIALNEAKRDPLDFVLWKSSKKGEPAWDSPWGKGRPGWHIECSAMSTGLLGQPFDIHGGGLDLKFPHHENEIAQSEAAHGEGFANIWMHVGLLQVNKEKMSKSLGNYFTIREVLEKHDVEVIRFFMLSSSYRSPVNYSEETLAKMETSIRSLYMALRGLAPGKEVFDSEYEVRFQNAMDDDFNTPEALAVLFDIAHEINRLHENKETHKAAELGLILKRLGGLMGILQHDPEAYLQGDVDQSEAAKIEQLIAARIQARNSKNWSEADRLRDAIVAMGVLIEDSAEGTTWRKS